jgi:hypothetical protein
MKLVLGSGGFCHFLFGGVWLYFVILASHVTAASGTSANDDFSRRFIVDESNIILSGTLSGATVEPGEPVQCCSESLWWSWTPQESGVALIYVRQWKGEPGRIFAFSGSDPDSLPASESLVAEVPLFPKRYVTFRVTRGSTYHIGVFSNDRTLSLFSVEVGIPPFPIIVEQPSTQTTSPGESALFTLGAASVANVETTIQWQFNGRDLPGETGAMLSLVNIRPENAGEYRALLTTKDASGAVTLSSAPAELFVGAIDSAPRLKLQREAGNLFLDISDEPGRSYRLECFTNLLSQPEALKYVSSTAFPLRVEGRGGQTFFRASVYHPENPICHLNLRQILFAKQRWAADKNIIPNSPTIDAEVNSYLTSGAPHCPEGGTYNYNSADTFPTCSVAGHFLETQ